MKKKVLISLVMVISIFMIGCAKKEWKLIMSQNTEFLEENLQNAFNTAEASYKDAKLTPLALLGEQVVAGKNYMLLCESDKGYKVAVLYVDLEGNASITKVTDFDIDKYANKDINLNNEELVGGWTSSAPGEAVVLEDKLDKAFTKAQSELVGVTYYPLVAFEKGDTYAIICFGRMSDLNGTTNVYVMTINTSGEKLAIAGVDLKDFNK